MTAYNLDAVISMNIIYNEKHKPYCGKYDAVWDGPPTKNGQGLD